MKIYSSRRDDLIAERDAYDAQTAELEGKVKERERAWRGAIHDTEDAIAAQVKEAIGPTSLDLEVITRSSWNDRGYDVTVQANEHSKFDENRALAWHIDIKLDSDGNLVKESSSWSGLKATTPEQIEDLKESVRVIEIVNSIDWKPIIDVAIPKWGDYVDTDLNSEVKSRKNSRQDYESLIQAEDLNDAIESGKWILMEGRPQTDYYRGFTRGDYFAKIFKQTDKFVTVTIIGENTVYAAQHGDDYAQQRIANSDNYTERIGKANFLRHVKKPFQTADIEF